MITVARCTRVEAPLWTWLLHVSAQYRYESGDRTPPTFTLDQIRDRWVKGDSRMMLWLALEKDAPVGYAVTQVVTTALGLECFVPEAYLAPAARLRGVPLVALAAFEKWALEHKCRAMHFSTFRPAAAYARLLRRAGFKAAETIFVKELN